MPRSRLITLVLVGLGAGFLSGLFGVGGGTVIVPALVAFAAFNRKLASGTSLAAIVPTSIAGVITYGIGGHVHWPTAGILAIGTVVGAQIGTWLLAKLSTQFLRWAFVVFLVVVAVQLLLTVPVRDGDVDLSWGLAVGLVAVGLVTGVLSGLLGVGGGIIVVPAMILLFGYSDLLAKGTSLLMMIPTALSGTIGNWRRKNVDLRAGLVIGVSACLTVTLGSLTAGVISPQLANILFVAFLAFLIVKTVLEALKARKKA
ncbi:sulfite exporter TauE/SafE family protein [Serinibacter arcticus]|uniref:sulfite exporter TauE/SafE family protein n=1 Tax=Serinibacter arcticus TaxID=1655435 RepID=UPI001F441D6F|nr:sulfite exporter TauE/SafE family protein [Serinibacter arcticus]